jgi:hypothetical protein
MALTKIPGYATTGQAPVVLNSISNKFNGVRTVFDLRLEQTIVTSIVDSRDLAVIVNGLTLIPYITNYTYPWINTVAPINQYRVTSNVGGLDGRVVIFKAPAVGAICSLTWRNMSNTKQTRRYPFLAMTIALGD